MTNLNRFVVAFSLLTVGCSQSDSPEKEAKAPAEKVSVAVVNYPLAFLARRVGGELVEVNYPVPPDEDPAYWEPTAEDVAVFQSADLILLNGADYAKWTLRTTLPWSRTVVTTRDVEDQYIKVPNAVVHNHGPEGEHSHAGIAPETWIDPQLAISQANVVKQEIQKLLPDKSKSIEDNFNELKEELTRLDERLKEAFAKSNLPWTAARPAFRYLGRRYDLGLQTMNWDPAELPSDEQLVEFDKLIAGSDSSLMLWAEKPNSDTSARLEKRGVRVVVFRLAEHRSEADDFLEVMRKNVEAIEAATGSQSEQ